MFLSELVFFVIIRFYGVFFLHVSILVYFQADILVGLWFARCLFALFAGLLGICFLISSRLLRKS